MRGLLTVKWAPKHLQPRRTKFSQLRAKISPKLIANQEVGANRQKPFQRHKRTETFQYDFREDAASLVPRAEEVVDEGSFQQNNGEYGYNFVILIAASRTREDHWHSEVIFGQRSMELTVGRVSV